MTGAEILLAAKGIEKSYGATRVLRGLDFELRAGEIHALLGGNGAGKSTLIRIVTGTTALDRGAVECRSRRRPGTVPVVGVVHQELALLNHLSVAENIGLAHARKGWRLMPFATTRAVAFQALKLIDVDLARRVLDVPVSQLSLHERQIVEIARALSLGAEILLLDEPTANLTAQETAAMFAVLRRLAQHGGMAIVFVSHRMREIRQLCDRCSIIRDGRMVVHAAPIATLTDADVIQHMGQTLPRREPALPRDAVDTALSAIEISGPDAFQMSLQPGTILGLAGSPSGPSALLQDLAGHGAAVWQLQAEGMPANFRSPAQAVQCGVGYVSGDRAGKGVLAELPLVDNIVAATRVFQRRLLTGRAELLAAGKQIDRLKLKAGSLWDRPGTLSGGNQQKLLLARWLDLPLRLFVLDEPTRGVDVGTKHDIYALLRGMASQGVAVVWYSTENAELLELCDSILAFDTAGKPAGFLSKTSFDEDGLAQLTGMAA